MKKWMMILLLIPIFIIAGCGDSEKPTEQPIVPNQDMKEISEFSIKIGNEIVSLQDWDNEIDLEELFGKPLLEETRQLEDSDTFTGSYMKELKYPGIELELFSPKANGESFYILSMDIIDSTYPTLRGIKVGDTLEELMETYPEIKPVLDGREDLKNMAYKIEEGAYNYINFEVKQGEIIKIKIYHEFA